MRAAVHRTPPPGVMSSPLPDGWPGVPPRREPWARLVLALALLVTAAGRGAIGISAGEAPAALVWLAAAGVLALVAGADLHRPGGQRQRPRLVRVGDRRVHLFPARGLPLLILLGVVLSVLMIASVLVTALFAVIDRQVWWLWVLWGLDAAAPAVAVAVAWRGIARHRPAALTPSVVGITLEREGVRVMPRHGDPIAVPWGRITAVRPDTVTVRRRTPEPVLVLDGAGVTVPLAGSAVHPWLVYAAVRFWHERPRARAELGTSAAALVLRQSSDAIRAAR